MQQLVLPERFVISTLVKALTKWEKIISVGYYGLLAYGERDSRFRIYLEITLIKGSLSHRYRRSPVERTLDSLLGRVQHQGQTALPAHDKVGTAKFGLKDKQALKATDLLYGPMMIFAKLSILLFYFRLFSPTKMFRILIHIGIVATLFNHVIGTILAIALCATSDPLGYSKCSHRLNPLNVVISVINIITDFYILFIPLLVLSKLQMRLRKKIGVGAVFCMGLLYSVPL